MMKDQTTFSSEAQLLIEELKSNGYFEFREISNRGLCCLNNFMFTTGIIIGLDMFGYYGRYCYSDPIDAFKSYISWDGIGDPPGNWIKYKGRGGERTNPNYTHK